MEPEQYKEMMSAVAELHTGQELIKQEITSVKEHLGTLNGKVATQAGQIGAMQIRDARNDGKKEGSKTTIVVLWIVGSTIFSTFGAVLFEHFFK